MAYNRQPAAPTTMFINPRISISQKLETRHAQHVLSTAAARRPRAAAPLAVPAPSATQPATLAHSSTTISIVHTVNAPASQAISVTVRSRVIASDDTLASAAFYSPTIEASDITNAAPLVFLPSVQAGWNVQSNVPDGLSVSYQELPSATQAGGHVNVLCSLSNSLDPEEDVGSARNSPVPVRSPVLAWLDEQRDLTPDVPPYSLTLPDDDAASGSNRARTSSGGTIRPALTPISSAAPAYLATGTPVPETPTPAPRKACMPQVQQWTAPEETTIPLQVWMAEAAQYIANLAYASEHQMTHMSEQAMEYYTDLLTQIQQHRSAMSARELAETRLRLMVHRLSIQEGLPMTVAEKVERLLAYWKGAFGPL